MEKRRITVLRPGGSVQATFLACKVCRGKVPLDEWEKLTPRRASATSRGLVVPDELVEAAVKRARYGGSKKPPTQ